MRRAHSHRSFFSAVASFVMTLALCASVFSHLPSTGALAPLAPVFRAFSIGAPTQNNPSLSSDIKLDARLSSPSEFHVDISPQYVRVVGAAVIDDECEMGTYKVAPLDELKRARKVCARVTHAMAEEGSARAREKMPDPVGWGHNKEVSIDFPDQKSYHGWFWNRSHMLAKSLGGPDIAENLVCGTRPQNVGANVPAGGMAYTETICKSWLQSHTSGFVDYIVTPLYVGKERIPRSVVVDVRSSDGVLNAEVEVYNCAYGYDIDYTSGIFKKRS